MSLDSSVLPPILPMVPRIPDISTTLVSLHPISSIPATLCWLGVGIIAFTYARRRGTRNFPLPPGPKKLPIVGNALSVPKGFEWVTYERWGKEFNSGIIHLDLFGQSIIIINSYKIAKELLDRRAIIYSGRPPFVMANDLMGGRVFFVHDQYGEAWKLRRSLFHRELHPSQTSRYQPHAIRAVRQNLHLFLDEPENFMQHNRDLVGASATLISYGIKVLEKNDPYILNAEKATHGLTQAQFPGLFLVESIPLLKYVPEWMPGANFKRLARTWGKHIYDMVELPFQELKRDRLEGRNALEPSFASYCLDSIKGEDVAQEELIVKESVGNFYFGAVDTSVSALNTFILAMVLYPGVQTKAQEELDRILPAGELPDFSYESSLPYISAIVKEVLRWRPVTPIGVPHRLITDDVFEGYHLPAKSMVIANTWAMLHDEETYPEPHVFKPERFIKDGLINPDVRDPSVTGAFGFGRRGCPGAHVAKSTIWVFVATMLKTMTIGKVRDEKGAEITPSPVYTSTTISHPLPFKCTMTPRSNEAEALIRAAGEEEDV